MHGALALSVFLLLTSQAWAGEELRGLVVKVIDGDNRTAVNIVGYFTGSNEEIEAYLKLLYIQTKQIVNQPDIWQCISKLATALLERKTLKGKEARKIIMDACMPPKIDTPR